MKANLAKVLDECFVRIRNGETVETCLAEHENVRTKLVPLLHTALYTAISVSTMPRAVPSDEFRRTSKGRLMARLSVEIIKAKVARTKPNISLLDEIATAGQNLMRAITGARKIAIPVTLALLIALVSGFGALSYLSPSPALASQSTLSVLSGNVEVRSPGADSWRDGTDGMTLTTGTRIRTSADSHALLTFFEGSTLKLEPSTDIEIKEVANDGEQATTIVLKQWTGKTWNRVVKMTGSGSRYEIETPSAYAMVRGTLFTTDVDETGATRVATTEGLVSVAAQDEEVQLPPNQQTLVETGAVPSQPTAMSSPNAEISIRIDTPAIGSVTDPTGASTGILPSGLPFNQIPGSQSSLLPDGTQVITIPQLTSGEYTLALRYITGGAARYTIQGKSDGEVAFNYVGTYEGLSESGWLIHVNVHVDDGFIVSSEVSGVEPLGDEQPEKIVKKATDKGKSPTIELTYPSEKDGHPALAAEKGQGNAQDNNGKSQGNNNTQDSNANQGNGQGNDNAQDNNAIQGNGQGQGNDKAQDNNANQGNGQGQGNDKAQDNTNQGNNKSQNDALNQDYNNYDTQNDAPNQDYNNYDTQNDALNQGNDQGQNNGQGNGGQGGKKKENDS